MFSSRKMRQVVRILYAYLLVAILSVTVACHSALAASPVEEYAQRTIDRGIALLKDPSLSGPARKAAMRAFLSENFDVKRIALFALGDAAASASPQELAEYLKSFENLTLDTYVSMIGDYGGQQVRVTGSKERVPGDFILTADVTDPAAAHNEKPLPVRFRVLSEGVRYSVVDASVQGVWFELAQRDSVQGFLGANGGSISKLITHINQLPGQSPAKQ